MGGSQGHAGQAIPPFGISIPPLAPTEALDRDQARQKCVPPPSMDHEEGVRDATCTNAAGWRMPADCKASLRRLEISRVFEHNDGWDAGMQLGSNDRPYLNYYGLLTILPACV